MTKDKKKRIPLKEGLWTTPSSPGEEPQLIGSKCPSCGEVYFPKKVKGLCVNCQATSLDDIKLSRRGKIFTYSVVMIQPGGGFYHGPVPYAYGYVELPEGVRLQTLFTDSNFDELKVNMDVELVIEKIDEDEEGNDIMTYKFRPVKER